MAVVQSAGALERVGQPQVASSRSLVFYQSQAADDYAGLYRRQPAVRTVVDFLARNVADLGIKTFRRVSDNERLEIGDHPLAVTLRNPNPWVSRYWFIHSLVSDMGIFDEFYALKARGPDGTLLLIRIPAQYVEPFGGSWLTPDGYRISGGKGRVELPAEQVWAVHGYNPDDPRRGLSPLETLRRVLAEEAASGEYRENFWKNSARIEGVIERPVEAPDWSDGARTRFREEWQARYAGAEGSGLTPVLEEGMKFNPVSFSARDSQWLEARKLTREEVASAYHIPPPMVGLLDHATFSNIVEQHRNLYQDTLGPWLTMIQEEIKLALLPEFSDADNVYVEFALSDKLRGDPQAEAAAIQASVGAPWRTRNEVRAERNLPPLDGGDEIVTPLNVLIGGQASPQDSAPPARGALSAKAAPRLAGPHLEAHRRALERFFTRQRQALASAVGAKGRKAAWDDVWDEERWDTELADDLTALGLSTATDFAVELARRYGIDDFSAEPMVPYLRASAGVAAANINRTTREALAAADPDRAAAVAAVFAAAALRARVDQIAQSRVTLASNFGQHEAASAAGVRTKTWIVTSPNARPSHAAMAGETVALGENFSNGGRWPGDPDLPVAEVAGCTCQVDFSAPKGLPALPAERGPEPLEIMAKALEVLSAAVGSLREPAVVNLHQAPITVTPPSVTVEAPEIHVDAPQVTVNPPAVTVEAPEIHVTSEAGGKVRRRELVRDEAGNITGSVEVEE